ncbi:MAG: hypothetical protein GYA36_16400, partial [Veillonellaceae bacterium]|nr:hypothetical protein [Veillonellaceae bacterium]
MVTTEFYDDTSSSDAAYALAIQADGKIIAAGSAGAFTRYNTDGSVDLSFGDAGHVDFTSIARDIAVQDDGKILVAGTGFGLKRYNSDGSLDATFGDGGTVHFSVGKGTAIGYSLAIQDDGRIVVAGTWTKSNDSALMIVRYNVDGTLDNTFDSDGILTFAFEGDETDVTSVALQDDGKIVVAGCVGESLDQDFLVVRCNSDGSMDNTFGDLGIVRTDFEGERDLANSVAIQSDGKIVLAGWAYSDFKGRSALARYNIDGALDTTFDTDGKAITDLLPLTTDDCAYGMVIQPDGQIALAGKSSDDFAVVRYNSD